MIKHTPGKLCCSESCQELFLLWFERKFSPEARDIRLRRPLKIGRPAIVVCCNRRTINSHIWKWIMTIGLQFRTHIHRHHRRVARSLAAAAPVSGERLCGYVTYKNGIVLHSRSGSPPNARECDRGKLEWSGGGQLQSRKLSAETDHYYFLFCS